MSKRKAPKASVEESFEHYIASIEEERQTETFNLNSYEDKKELERIYKTYVDFGLVTLQGGFKESAVTLCDAGKPFIKKRFNTIMQMLPEACRRFKESYPNLCIEREFVVANAVYNVMTYDLVDAVENVTLAAALWILDELEQRWEINKVLPLLPDEDEISGIKLPNLFEDSCHDNSLIRGMMYIILQRNDDMKTSRPQIVKSYVNEASLKRAEKIHEYKSVDDPLVSCETNRQKFDYIMSLIHPAVVERTVKRFEEKEWEIFDRYLQCVNRYRTEELQLIEEIHAALLKQKKLFPIIQKVREDRERIAQDLLKGTAGSAVLAKRPSIDEMLSLRPPFLGTEARRMVERSAEEREFDRLIDEITAKEELRSKIRGKQDAISYFLGSPKPDDSHRPEDVPAEDIPDVEAIHQLVVLNPYETCFAFLYLLDSGSPLPWLAPLGVMVLEAAAELLPWHRYPAYDEEDLDDEEYYEEDDEEDSDETIEDEETDEEENVENTESDTPESDLIPTDWIEEEAKLYERKFKYPKYIPETNDYAADDTTILNFPQFVYSETNVAIPRNVFHNADMADIYMLAGFNESEARLLEKYMTLADFESSKSSELRRKKLGNYPDADKEDEAFEEETKPEEVDVDALRQDIRRLKEEIKKSHDEKRVTARELETLKSEKEELVKQLAELRTMVRGLNTTSSNEVDTTPEITFPYSAKGRYVVFGGHDSWSRAIKPLLANVRFIDADAHPNVGLILHADTVWVQSNAIAHSDYYKILDVVRTHGIKLEYFSYASAEKCAEQLALYDLEQN